MRPKNLSIIDNEAYIRDIKLSDLVKTYKSPLYVYDEEELVENLRLFKNNFVSPNFNGHVVYASKAFLVPYLANLCNQEGIYIDAVSIGDLYVLKESNFNLQHVVFHGNNKTIEEIEFAVQNNIGIIVVDHIEELVTLNNIAQKYNKVVNTMFRVNPGISAHTHKYIQTSTYVSKFGESIYDEAKIEKIISIYKVSKNITLKGFHSHIGSQIHEIEPFLVNVEKMMKFSKDVMNKYHIELDSINFGGGFGVDYTEAEVPLDTKNCLHQMIDKINEEAIKNDFLPKNVYIEPGRSIVCNTCVTLYTIGDFKHTFGEKNYVFIDGGMTDNIRPALYQASYSVDVCNKMNNPKEIKADVAGKCCESGDVIAVDAQLPIVENGDTLMVYSTGAYTYSMASNYNNNLKPAVVFLTNKPHVVSRRETLEDLMKLFK